MIRTIINNLMQCIRLANGNQNVPQGKLITTQQFDLIRVARDADDFQRFFVLEKRRSGNID